MRAVIWYNFRGIRQWYYMLWVDIFLLIVAEYLDEYHLKNESLLIGGEACLWTEYADDDSITPRLW